VKFEIEAEIPAGYEPTGEFRLAKEQEIRLIQGRAMPADWQTHIDYVILRRVEPWRPMVVADLVNGPVQARVKMCLDDDWLDSRSIEGYCWNRPHPWTDSDKTQWKHAEVRDEV